MKPQTSQQLAARRREVVSLTHKGWTQEAIASHLQIPQGTVSRDLASMREYWREFPVYDFEKVRFEQLQKIDLIEAEAWAAWQRSQQKKHSASITRGKNGEQTRTGMQDQFGDPRYLREIGKCVAQRNEMIGVQPPTPPAESDECDIPESDLAESFRYYLLLHSMFGDPPYQPQLGLTAEQIAALVAEHESEPTPHGRVLKAVERAILAANNGAEGQAVGHGQQPASPGNPSADDLCAERSP